MLYPMEKLMRTKLTLSCAAIVLTLTASCSRDPQKVKLQYAIAGDKSAAKGDYAEAIIQYRKAVAVDSRFGPARFKLAEAYERTGDLRNALREYVRERRSSDPSG